MLNRALQSSGHHISPVRASLASLSMAFFLAGCGGGDDADGGGAASLTCTDQEIMTASGGKVRSATSEELAGYVRGYTGSFDPVGNNTYLDASATFSSKGEVTVKWTGGEKTYTGTSFCYDTTIGAVDYGNTLYVKFAEGKVDLWKKNGVFSGWVKASQ